MNEQILWTEKYRPTKVDDCVLPDTIKNSFKEYVKTKNIPNLLLSGSAGAGKTTIAKALCNEVGCDFIVINGSDEGRRIDEIRDKIKGYASSISLSGGRKVIIIDEADYMNPESTQPFLRAFIEQFAQNCSFIFTCNRKNQIIEPIHSRCSVIDFRIQNSDKAKMAAQFYKRVEWILQQENVEFDKEVVATLITKHFPDNRRILNELQRYSQFGNIDTGILAQIGDVSVSELIRLIAAKDFSSIRKWVGSNEIDSGVLFRKLYDSMYDSLKPQSIPQAVLILADYQYKAAFVADQEINTVACLTELMVNCEFV